MHFVLWRACKISWYCVLKQITDVSPVFNCGYACNWIFNFYEVRAFKNSINKYLCVSQHAHIHTCVFSNAHAHMRACKHTAWLCVYVCTCQCTYVWRLFGCARICVCKCVCMRVCVWKHMCELVYELKRHYVGQCNLFVF